MASEKSTTVEYAFLSERIPGDGTTPVITKAGFPCNIKVLGILFHNSPVPGYTEFKSIQEVMEKIKSYKAPLVLICITQMETHKYKLARELLEQPHVFKWTGSNTFYSNKHIFTDIIFETGAK